MMKNILLKTILLVALISATILSCENKENINDCGCELCIIKYGTSYNNCLGYCKRDLILRQGIVTFKKSGWADTIVPKECRSVLPDTTWNRLQADIDPDIFFNLPATIGCPDCADGGSEWIEIELNNGEKHRSNWDYWSGSPLEIRGYVTLLRSLMASYGNSCP